VKVTSAEQGMFVMPQHTPFSASFNALNDFHLEVSYIANNLRGKKTIPFPDLNNIPNKGVSFEIGRQYTLLLTFSLNSGDGSVKVGADLRFDADVDPYDPVPLPVEYYVAQPPLGNDANDGLSPQTPFETFGKAINAIDDGRVPATLYIMDDFWQELLDATKGDDLTDYQKGVLKLPYDIPPITLTNYKKPVKLMNMEIGDNCRVDLRGDVTFCKYTSTISTDINGNIQNGFVESNIVVKAGGIFNMYSGKITLAGNSVAGTTHVEVKGGTFNMYGGEITGNNTTTEAGGVFVNGTFNMYGGTITGNNTTGQTGGVYVPSGGVFNMYGGTITGNTLNGTTDNDVKIASGGIGRWMNDNAHGEVGFWDGTVEPLP
jgi:hypothetical protein